MTYKKLHKIIKRGWRILFGQPTELEFVKRSLQKHRYDLQDMLADFDPTKHCCPDCMYGSYYSDLVSKIERIEHRLKILQNRKTNKK